MKIAIQGHTSRGEEVKKILETLINNSVECDCNNPHIWYEVHGKLIIPMVLKSSDYKYYTLEEFEKEFPFKIGDKVRVLNYYNKKGTILTILSYGHTLGYSIKLESGKELYRFATNLKRDEEMNTRNITLTLDKAKEWYNKGGELKEIALQAFTENELHPLPKSWEEYYKGYKVSAIIFGPCVPNKYIALWKLEQLRDCYRQGWKPNWTTNYEVKHCISTSSNKLFMTTRTSLVAFLAFQSREITEEFLKNFEPLIKEAGDLI